VLLTDFAVIKTMKKVR